MSVIEVPVLLPVAGIIIFILFGYLLIKILNEIKSLKGQRLSNLDYNDKADKNIKKIEEIPEQNLIKSPMVGVVYLSSSPDKPPFVKIDDHIKQGQVLFLIEAMKTFNEIRAPRSGVIKDILVSNNKPVEFGEKLIVIE